MAKKSLEDLTTSGGVPGSMDSLCAQLELLRPWSGATARARHGAAAWQQKRLADIRLQNDLYDRRFKIFAAAKKLLVSVQQNGVVSLDEFFAFVGGTSDAVFLLTADVVDYLQTIRERSAELRSKHGLLQNSDLEQGQRAALADQIARIEDWFNDQFDVLVAKFKPSMRLDKHALN
jgi:hypothetical protein